MKSFVEYVDVARHILSESKETNITPEEIIKALEKETRYTLDDWSVNGLINAIRYVLANGATNPIDMDEILL